MKKLNFIKVVNGKESRYTVSTAMGNILIYKKKARTTMFNSLWCAVIAESVTFYNEGVLLTHDESIKNVKDYIINAHNERMKEFI